MTNNSHKINQLALLSKFQCLADKCEDTCCKGWGMQLDPERKKLYEKQAPELLDAVTSGEAELIMKRDPETDYCVKFTDGLCSIHRDYGDKFLGDACNFYPRVTRKFGNDNYMTASVSCPEIARLAFFEADPFGFTQVEIDRIPYSTKEYLTDEMQKEGLKEEEVKKLIEAFTTLAGDEKTTPEQAVMKIVSVSNSLSRLPKKSWAEAIDFMIKTVDGRLPEPETDELDNMRLLQNLAGLIHASKKTARPRLDDTIRNMETALGVKIDWITLDLTQVAEPKLKPLTKIWQTSHLEYMNKILRRWLQIQLVEATWPFAGFGGNLQERAIILAVRFATVKLALISSLAEKNPPEDEVIIKTVQSIARFLGHLADPELSLRLYKEAGWNREARLRGMVDA